MPGLTVDTSPQSQSQSQSQSESQPQSQSQSQSHPHTRESQSSSASPTHDAPPYSPITPTLAAARLAQQPPPPPQTYSYTHSQEPQVSIPQPAPVPITFEENPDALALKSAISILQMQARNATRDIVSLQRIKEKAMGDPEGFIDALGEGKVGGKKGGGDGLFDPAATVEDSDDDEEEEGHVKVKERNDWGTLPTPQNVVRCPPINWNQYAVVGESLEKLHRDQLARPTEGMPQRVGSDGQLLFGGEGSRRQTDMGVAAPYMPGKDRIEKVGARKSGKK